MFKKFWPECKKEDKSNFIHVSEIIFEKLRLKIVPYSTLSAVMAWISRQKFKYVMWLWFKKIVKYDFFKEMTLNAF